MFPAIDPATIANPGERVLYTALRDQLPADWGVRYHYPACIFHGGCLRECEADFIVAAPGRGLMFLETKSSRGWECRDAQWYRIEQSGDHVPTENPFFQASGAKHTIVEKLAKKLGLAGKSHFPGIFAHAVVYPLATVIGSLPASQDPQVIITRKDMKDLKQRLQDAFEAWSNPARPRGQLFTDQVMRRTIQILRDDCRFVVTEGASLDADETAITELTQQQFDFFKGVLSNRRLLVRGVAGSGKTLLAQLAADMFAQRGKRVLLLCYNNVLAAWLQKTTVKGRNRWETRSYFSLCRELCHLGNVQFTVPEDKDGEDVFWRETAPNMMCSAIDTLGDDCKYDAIVVDEAQDFRQDWWFPLQLLLRNEAANLCVFLDPDQSLYGHPEAYPADIAESVLELNENCRNTKRIAFYSGQVLGKQIKSFDLSPDGVSPEVLDACPNVQQRVDQVRNLVTNLLKQGFLPSQIAVLSPWRSENNPNCTLHHIEALGGRPITGRSSGSLQTDLEQWKTDRALWGGTIKSFKGMEASCVILTDLPVPDASPSFTRKDLYVAASRAKHRLLLLPSTSEAYRSLMDGGGVVR